MNISDISWDVVVIGGGASGLGCAIESSSRGYRTLLLEKNDFSESTSSRSTKLIHGGVRYLEQGDIQLVKEALAERSYLLNEIPEIVEPISIILPTQSTLYQLYYRMGLFLYDHLTFLQNNEKSRGISKRSLISQIPSLNRCFSGGVQFMDAQFDDSRLAIQLAKTVCDYGGSVKNYTEVNHIDSVNKKLTAKCSNGHKYTIRFEHLINATGIFHDVVCRMEDPDAKTTISLSRGTHLILKPDKFKQERGLIIPKTHDGRVLFVLPWKGKMLAGTTDIPVEKPEVNPIPDSDEISFIKETIEKYYDLKIDRDDIISSFSGLRPLAHVHESIASSKISRSHKLRLSKNSMISISGGKWTTFRKMGEDCINFLENNKGLEKTLSLKHKLRINKDLQEWKSAETKLLDRSLAPEEIQAIVRYFFTNEWARTTTDILARRTRLELLEPDLATHWRPIIDNIFDSNKDLNIRS